MGMVACFAAVSPDVLTRLMENEDSIEEYLFPDDGDSEPSNYIDIDKAWHGIHYLLTGEAWGGSGPQALAVTGGKAFGPEVGYGPARYLLPDEVAKVSLALDSISIKELKNRYNPTDMSEKEIYPQMWECDGDEELSYLLEYYPELVDFYHGAASRGDAVILWMC